MVLTQNSPVRPLNYKKRRQILDVASQIFSEKGYHMVTMDEVAMRAQVGKGTIYRYFEDKEDLYFSIIEEGLNFLTEGLEQEHRSSGQLADKLRRMVHAIVLSFIDHLPFFRIINGDEGRFIVRKKELFEAKRRGIADLLGLVIEEGMAHGVFRKTDRVMTPSMLIGMAWGVVLNHANDAPAEDLARRVAELALHGVLISRA